MHRSKCEVCIKNVIAAVIVTNTHHLKGIPAVAAAGIRCRIRRRRIWIVIYRGNRRRDKRNRRIVLNDTEITVEHINNGCVFDIIVDGISRGR